MFRTLKMRGVLGAAALLLSLAASGAQAAPVRARVLFIGDIMAHIQQIDAAERSDPKGGRTWDFAPQFHRVKPLLAGAFVVGNLETTFAGESRGYAGYPSFNTPDSLTEALKGLEIDLVTLANNHILDRGASGARRTAEVLDGAGIAWTGLGTGEVPANDALLLEREGLRWAFVNWTYGSNRSPASKDVHLNVISEPAVAAGMARARALSADVVVACFHWGDEYHLSPNARQRQAADQALAEGADLVIGTHPHVLQPVEVRVGEDGAARAVAWSLGNFVSFQRTLPRERTCILSAEFERGDDDRTRLTRLAAAPLQVLLMPSGRRVRRTEVTYAGTGRAFNHFGLSKEGVARLQRAGHAVLDFLGAQEETDEWGFYTLWSEASPDVLPTPRRTSPSN